MEGFDPDEDGATSEISRVQARSSHSVVTTRKDGLLAHRCGSLLDYIERARGNNVPGATSYTFTADLVSAFLS